MFDAVTWARNFRKASASGNGEVRREVCEGTAGAVRERTYSTRGARVTLDHTAFDALHAGTVFYPGTDDLVVDPARRGRHATVVSVHNADFLEIARAVSTPDRPAAVLNMASRRNPGGGVAHGAGAQEENLFRRSNICYSLFQFVDYAREYGVPRHPSTAYPIPHESGGIFSPGVTVFRSAESTGYAFLRHPYRVNVLTVPAINRPDLEERDGLLWLTEAMADGTRRKIRAILHIAAHHDQLDLVLSAFGCGAFKNPPHHVAALFRETLAEPEFAGIFRRVAFAIIDDHNAFHRGSPEGNYLPFERVLAGR